MWVCTAAAELSFAQAEKAHFKAAKKLDDVSSR
jgi:hypothetical protein